MTFATIAFLSLIVTAFGVFMIVLGATWLYLQWTDRADRAASGASAAAERRHPV